MPLLRALPARLDYSKRLPGMRDAAWPRLVGVTHPPRTVRALYPGKAISDRPCQPVRTFYGEHAAFVPRE